MTSPMYARIAGRLLARDNPAPPPAPSQEQRGAAIAAIARAIAERAQKRRRQRWLGGLAAAAAVAAIAGGVTLHPLHRSRPVASIPAAPVPTAATSEPVVGYTVNGAASVVALGTPAPLLERRALPAGSRVVTPAEGRVMLAFATGTDVLLGEAGDMTITGEDTTQQLRLDHGSLDLHVAKLAPDQRFLVETPDAEIEVRGTAFKVSLTTPDATCGAGTPTRITVSDGVVIVRHAGQETSVQAGQSWPAGCVTTARGGRPSSTPASARSAAVPAPASSLGEQNDLFADAMSAKRRGDSGRALATLDRFLATYPSSPLAESATVERMRLLRGMDAPRAAAAAKRYLARYPGGFARAEAEDIAAGAP